MYQEAVMVPMGKWAEKRLAKLSENDKRRDESRTLSGLRKSSQKTSALRMVVSTGRS
jgi:site-specific DNA-methyltransferase (adenine-specific)